MLTQVFRAPLVGRLSIPITLIMAWLLIASPQTAAAPLDWGKAGQGPGAGESTPPSRPSTPTYERPTRPAQQPPTKSQPTPPSPGAGQPGTAERPKAVLSTPQSVQYGTGFVLDGSKSSAAAGRKIVKYVWTWVNLELRTATTEPRMEVAFRDKNPIPAGVNQFQLAVEDDRGGRSEPASAQVIVQKPPVVEKERPQPSKRGATERPHPSKRKGED